MAELLTALLLKFIKKTLVPISKIHLKIKKEDENCEEGSKWSLIIASFIYFDLIVKKNHLDSLNNNEEQESLP